MKNGGGTVITGINLVLDVRDVFVRGFVVLLTKAVAISEEGIAADKDEPWQVQKFGTKAAIVAIYLESKHFKVWMVGMKHIGKWL